MVQDMNTTIHVHGPYQFAAQHVEDGDGGFTYVQADAHGTRVALIRPTRFECDLAIAAFTAARNMLPESAPHPFARPVPDPAGRPDSDVCTFCGRPESEHAARDAS
jgi:hypothetical protein